jgi:hypothetical protein
MTESRETTMRGVCEIVSGAHPDPLRRTCQSPADLRYPAMGGGYMRLCAEHGERHKRYCERWNGETWEGAKPIGVTR